MLTFLFRLCVAGSNKRELEREEFRRMSLVRSSTISTKNTPSISSTSINTSV